MSVDQPPVLTPPTPELAAIIRTVIAREAAARVSQFEELLPAPGSVVMLGASIVAGGMWKEWFPHLPIVNRGIAGDTVSAVRARLRSAIHEPRVISVLVGANDIAPFGTASDSDPIAAEFDALVAELRERAPRALLIVTGVTPRTAELATAITALNSGYRQTAHRHGAQFLDLWPHLAGEQGELRGELTLDDLHLTGAGYRVWVEALRPLLDD